MIPRKNPVSNPEMRIFSPYPSGAQSPRFGAGLVPFFSISRKSSVYAETTGRSPHKQTCRSMPRLAKKTISEWKQN